MPSRNAASDEAQLTTNNAVTHIQHSGTQILSLIKNDQATLICDVIQIASSLGVCRLIKAN
jgi:hypothetical protein